MRIKMSKASKARKEKLGRGFGSIPVAQRNAYAKQYHAPGARSARILRSVLDRIQSVVQTALSARKERAAMLARHVKDIKQNPDGSSSYTLIYPPKMFFGEYILPKEPEDKNELP
jgi:hypothetical protein